MIHLRWNTSHSQSKKVPVSFICEPTVESCDKTVLHLFKLWYLFMGLASNSGKMGGLWHRSWKELSPVHVGGLKLYLPLWLAILGRQFCVLHTAFSPPERKEDNSKFNLHSSIPVYMVCIIPIKTVCCIHMDWDHYCRLLLTVLNPFFFPKT